MPVVRTPSPAPLAVTNAIKRNSRKISLTCQNVKRTSSPPPPFSSHPSSVTTIKSPPTTHPICTLSSPSSVLSSTLSVCSSKKKSVKSKSKSLNRLKSPLPSPIVSPLPSPSRNRFQVSKVADASLSPGSFSTGSSPTFFPNSRFSVTRVVLPPTPPVKNTSLSLMTDSAMSSSVESPDMEVKRYMNDSCSSLDSNNDLNVSMSSTDSFDLILRDVPPIEVGPLRKSTLTETPSYRLNDSLSSFEASGASSTESLIVGSADEPKVISSNEGTLTNSPCDKVDAPPAVAETVRSDATATPANRSRKNSWIPNPMSKSNSDNNTSSGYPATLDKLFSLFQHPTAIFQRSSPDLG